MSSNREGGLLIAGLASAGKDGRLQRKATRPLAWIEFSGVESQARQRQGEARQSSVRDGILLLGQAH